MERKKRSTSGVILVLAVAIFLCFAMAAYSQESPQKTGAAATWTAVAGRESLAMAKVDSTAGAEKIGDSREHAWLDGLLKIRYSGLGNLYVRGGVFMHLILACSLAGAIFIIDRTYTLNRARVDTKKLTNQVLKTLQTEGVEAALRVCERTRGPIAAVLHAGLLRAGYGPEAVREAIEMAGALEVSFLERGLAVIATSSTVAPMFGFLGMVSGTMNAFAAIEAAGQASAVIVASGIQEALITTIAGLSIGILCAVSHSYCTGMIDRFVLEMEGASANLVNELRGTVKK